MPSNLYASLIADAKEARELGDSDLELKILEKADALKSSIDRIDADTKLDADPTSGMTGGQKFAAGYGKAGHDLMVGAGQRLRGVLPAALSNAAGLPDEQSVAEMKQRDASLMQSGAGVAGNVLGNIAAALPAAIVPGANTVAGGAVAGAVTGALQPTAQGDSVAGNAIAGGALGGAIPAGMGVFRAARAATDPVLNQNRVIGGALMRAVGEDNAASTINALKGPGAATPGAVLSAGQVSGDGALSAVEDTLRAQLPGGVLSRQGQSNSKTLADVLRGIGQDDTALEAAKHARSNAVSSLYGKAEGQSFPIDQTLTDMMDRPALAQALKAAGTNAANRGEAVIMDVNGSPTITGKAAHEIKLALDDAASQIKRESGAGSRAADGVDTAKDDFLAWLESQSPEYAQAKSTYAAMSRPINQMQVGRRLADTMIPATAGDAPATLNYTNLARALRNPDQVARTATGFKGARMASVMEPDQLSAINAVNSDASRIAEALKRGNGYGSATARRGAVSDMISAHLEHNAPGALKLASILNVVPVAGSATRKALSVAGDMVASPINSRIVAKMDEMLATNPQQVADLLAKELARMTPAQQQSTLKAIGPDVLKRLPQAAMLSAVGSD